MSRCRFTVQIGYDPGGDRGDSAAMAVGLTRVQHVSMLRGDAAGRTLTEELYWLRMTFLYENPGGAFCTFLLQPAERCCQIGSDPDKNRACPTT